MGHRRDARGLASNPERIFSRLLESILQAQRRYCRMTVASIAPRFSFTALIQEQGVYDNVEANWIDAGAMLVPVDSAGGGAGPCHNLAGQRAPVCQPGGEL